METPDWRNEPLLVLDLSVRSRIHAERRNITTLGQLCDLSEDDVMEWNGFGESILRDIRSKLAERGLALKPSLYSNFGKQGNC